MDVHITDLRSKGPEKCLLIHWPLKVLESSRQGLPALWACLGSRAFSKENDELFLQVGNFPG